MLLSLKSSLKYVIGPPLQVTAPFWHAVMPLSALASGPQPFTLLGEAIVLFLDAQGEPAALRDRCCHRTAKLSRGWCVDAQGQACERGHIQCGYHGWTYDRGGKVIRIPQYEESRAVPPDYKTQAYHCTARYGYAWVALDEPIADIPDIPEFSNPAWRTIFQFYETWATSPMRALENSFDNSHFSFVHRATFGVPDAPQPSQKAFDTALWQTLSRLDPRRPVFVESESRKIGSVQRVLIDEIAASQNFSTSRFLSTLYDEALEINGSVSNFASLLRTSCLIYLMSKAQHPGEPQQFHIIAAE